MRAIRLDVVERDGHVWHRENSSRVPWCFENALSQSGWRPDSSWSKDLLKQRIARQVICLLEPLPINPRDWLKVQLCYANTAIFHYPSRWTEAARCEYTSRTWPLVHFAEFEGELYEVTGGKCIHVFDRWQMEWFAYKNTDLARHFNGKCDEQCWPCQLWGVVPVVNSQIDESVKPMVPSAVDLDAVAEEERIREATR